MITYFLGLEETRAYLRDFLGRLERFVAPPTVWCPVTRSGQALVKEMLGLVAQEFPNMAETVQVLPISVDHGNKSVRFLGGDPAVQLRGQSVLLLDGAIHSGGMMSRVAAEVLRFEPAELSSYALVIKRASRFVPTLWGLMIGETDRAFFLLDSIPNNRLDAAGHNAAKTKKQPHVHIERLNDTHVKLPPVASQVPSMDRITWSDRVFQMQASEHHTCTYVLQHGAAIVGYLTVHGVEADFLMIDEIAVDQNQQKKGYGGVLMRFADTLARHADCRYVRLLGIDQQVDFYKGFEYRLLEARDPIILDAETYRLMERAVLYHQSPIR